MIKSHPALSTHPILVFARRVEAMMSQDAILSEFCDVLSVYSFEFLFYRVKYPAKGQLNNWENISLGGSWNSEDFSNPFFKYCCSTFAMTYSGGEFLKDYPYLKPDELNFFQAGVDAGFSSGLAIPVAIGTTGRIGGFNIGTRLPKADFLTLISPLADKIALACVLIDRRLEVLWQAENQRKVSKMPADALGESLTDREQDVLFLLSKGSSRKVIARKLDLSPSTIAGYIKNIYKKIGVSNQSDATRKAITMGLTPPQL